MPHGKAVKVETCTTLVVLLGTYTGRLREVKLNYKSYSSSISGGSNHESLQVKQVSGVT